MKNLLLGVAVLLAAGGCKSKQRTELVVRVGSNLAIPTKLDKVDLAITSNGKTQHAPYSLLSDYQLPLLVGIVESRDRAGALTIVATGYANGVPLVSETAVLDFVEGKSMLLNLYLAAECIGDPCKDPSKTCTQGGVCRDPARTPSELTPYVPGSTPVSTVPVSSGGAGGTPDAGVGRAEVGGTGGSSITASATATGGSGGYRPIDGGPSLLGGGGAIEIDAGLPPSSSGGSIAIDGPTATGGAAGGAGTGSASSSSSGAGGRFIDAGSWDGAREDARAFIREAGREVEAIDSPWVADVGGGGGSSGGNGGSTIGSSASGGSASGGSTNGGSSGSTSSGGTSSGGTSGGGTSGGSASGGSASGGAGAAGSSGTVSLTASPNVYDFGPTMIGASSLSTTLTVSNTGAVASGAISLDASSLRSEFTIVQDTCIGNLTVGATCTLVIAFRPSAIATVADTLHITSSAGGSLSIPLVGVGMGAPADAAADTGSAPCSKGDFTLVNAPASCTTTGFSTNAKAYVVDGDSYQGLNSTESTTVSVSPGQTLTLKIYCCLPSSALVSCATAMTPWQFICCRLSPHLTLRQACTSAATNTGCGCAPPVDLVLSGDTCSGSLDLCQ